MTSKDVEDEQHCLFSGPAYSDVRLSNLAKSMPVFFQQAFSVSDFFTNSAPNPCGGILRVVSID